VCNGLACKGATCFNLPRDVVADWGTSMPRPERALDPSAGAVQGFAGELRVLRQRAGTPGYRKMATAGRYSATTLADAAGGHRLPALPVVLAYVRACGGDLAEWEERWRQTARRLAEERRG